MKLPVSYLPSARHSSSTTQHARRCQELKKRYKHQGAITLGHVLGRTAVSISARSARENAGWYGVSGPTSLHNDLTFAAEEVCGVKPEWLGQEGMIRHPLNTIKLVMELNERSFFVSCQNRRPPRTRLGNRISGHPSTRRINWSRQLCP